MALSKVTSYKAEDELKDSLSNLVSLPFAAVESVAGTISHELGHHLYYQNKKLLSVLAKEGFEQGWALPLSFYAQYSPEEMFAESLSVYMLSGPEGSKRIYPGLLKWLEDNGKK